MCEGVTCSLIGVLGVLGCNVQFFGVLGWNRQSHWCAGCVRVEPAVFLVCRVCWGVTCSLVGVLGVLGCNMQSRWCVGCVRV